MDKLTDICLVLSVLVAFSIVCVGVVQLAKRKSLLKYKINILNNINSIIILLYTTLKPKCNK